MTPEPVPNEAIDRLLRAWRGEVEAGAVYELIAQRELDERRAQILRRMAEAESGHRARIERRLTELGVPIPDPATVKPSFSFRCVSLPGAISSQCSGRSL
jgi:rubrerythrin